MSDTIYSLPGALTESFYRSAPTGLVGTIGYQIERKSDGVIVVPRTTAGIVETPTGSGRYKATFNAPTVQAAYAVLWDEGEVTPDTTDEDSLQVTMSPASIIEGEAGHILTLAEYKSRREMSEASPERDEAIEAALESAEDAVLNYTDRDFTSIPAVETRTYPWEAHTMVLDTDDFIGQPTNITFEAPGGIGEIAFPTTAYWVGPREGKTFYWIDFTPSKNLAATGFMQMGFTRNLDTYFERNSFGSLDAVNVKVTAEFGWPGGAPAGVRQAVTWLVDEFRKDIGGAEDIQSESIADLSYVYQRQRGENPDLPPRVQQILDPYRRTAL